MLDSLCTTFKIKLRNAIVLNNSTYVKDTGRKGGGYNYVYFTMLTIQGEDMVVFGKT